VCAIVALFKHTDLAIPLSLVRDIADKAAHRGPDGFGAAGFAGAHVVHDLGFNAWDAALAHRRLSILDLSERAAQPMVHRDRYWLTYNGEIYNYRELRTELERHGHAFRTASDSEVILAAFAAWGPQSFERLRGMWGLVLLDMQTRTAVACRDRLGMKPLFIWQSGEFVAVVSELKQLLGVPGFRARRDPQAVTEFLATGYENQSRTFFADVRPVQPGTYVTICIDRLLQSAPQPYWHPERIEASQSDPVETGRAFAARLDECVRLHLRSDVPVGCALSGGLDSSAIAVLAGRQTADEFGLQTFTAVCDGDPAEERQCVDAMLNVLHTSPHFVSPSPQGFVDDLDRFVWHHEEPVSSLSMYAGYCVARSVAAAGVRVMLSGEGGDEVLSGYWQSYFLYLRELALKGRMLTLGTHFASALFPGGNPALLAQVPAIARRYADRRRGSAVLEQTSPFVSGVLQDALKARGQSRRLHEIRTMYLPRLLKWDDRNFMAFSVEGRYPFLDHELIELCLSFKPEVLYRRGWTKWPLRSGLGASMPTEVAWRRSKFGFWVPQDRWLCGPLRPLLTEWLSADRPLWGLVERGAVRKLANETWRLHGRVAEPGQALVRCFMLDKWLEAFSVA